MSIRQKIKDIDNRGIVAIIGKKHTIELGLILINLCLWSFILSPIFGKRVVVIDIVRAEETSVAVVSPDSGEAEASVIQGNGEVERINAELVPTPEASRLEQMIRQEFGSEADNAILVAKCESQFNPKTVGDKHLAFDYNGERLGESIGLFQIRTGGNENGKVWSRPAKLGISVEQFVKNMQDPIQNIRYAKQIYDRGNWSAWTCARNLNLK